MKKTQKNSFRVNKYSYLVLGVILFLVAAILADSNLINKNQVNLVEESKVSSNLITLEGVIVKDSPQGLPGQYYLTNLNGNMVKLLTTINLDSLEGSFVRATGKLVNLTADHTTQEMQVSDLNIISQP